MKEKAPIEVINDVDGRIVNLFRQLRDHGNQLCRLVALTPYSSQELHNARALPPTKNSLEDARRFLVEAMMAVNGTFGKDRGGFSFTQAYSRGGKEARVSRWYNLPDRIEKVIERLRKVRIEKRDAREILDLFSKRPATLVYLDPPYLGSRTNGYTIDANSESFHIDLLRKATRARCMVMISAYRNPLYMDILTKRNGWRARVIEATTRDSSGRDISREELVWMNNHSLDALRRGRLPIHLSAREKRLGKVNPVRR
jgi:DNA adenine methylase